MQGAVSATTSPGSRSVTGLSVDLGFFFAVGEGGGGVRLYLIYVYVEMDVDTQEGIYIYICMYMYMYIYIHGRCVEPQRFREESGQPELGFVIEGIRVLL